MHKNILEGDNIIHIGLKFDDVVYSAAFIQGSPDLNTILQPSDSYDNQLKCSHFTKFS